MNAGIAMQVSSVRRNGMSRMLTPDLENGFSEGDFLSTLTLLFMDEQQARGRISGDKIFERLLPDQKSYVASPNDLICKCLEVADLEWLRCHPQNIPELWREQHLCVYAWKSVTLLKNGRRSVPFLSLDRGEPYIHWHEITTDWFWYQPAGITST
jgi:hypothetical protein